MQLYVIALCNHIYSSLFSYYVLQNIGRIPAFYLYTVQTVAADLSRGEHIPKMQNNIGRKSKLRVLRQPRSKYRGGGVLYAVPCHAALRSARPGAGFCTTALDLR
jgi:hypothetical protein